MPRLSRIVALALLVLAGTALPADSPTAPFKPPPPPPGFAWHEAKNGVGTFLVPEGWFVKEEEQPGTRALFISREDINVSGRFVVGLSVNQLGSWSTHAQGRPSKYAKAVAAALRRSKKVLSSGVVKGNVSDMHVVRVMGDNNGVPTIVHHIAIGMDDKDVVYLISFEAPASEWDEQIKLSGMMLNFFFLGS